ncbi:MAG: hypothetical protein Kow0092_24790 [Deferrisomatales bacterium]
MRAPRLPRTWALLCLCSLVGGCAGPPKRVRATLDNRPALASTLERPAAGSVEQRTYRDASFLGRRFPMAVVARPTVVARAGGAPARARFLAALEEELWAGTVEALRASGRFGAVRGGEGGVPDPEALRCTVEALPHVAALGERVRPDPVFRDPRPKIVLVFTLTEAATGRVVLKYTDWRISQWEYGPWAMEELRALALETVRTFGAIVADG